MERSNNFYKPSEPTSDYSHLLKNTLGHLSQFAHQEALLIKKDISDQIAFTKDQMIRLGIAGLAFLLALFTLTFVLAFWFHESLDLLLSQSFGLCLLIYLSIGLIGAAVFFVRRQEKKIDGYFLSSILGYFKKGNRHGDKVRLTHAGT